MELTGHFLLVGGIFVGIDAIWLSVVANKFYKSQLGGLLKPKPNILPAVVFYVLYVVGMLVFALEPALDRASLGYAASHGALLGLLMYATYDLTNQATLKHWPWKITITDLIWGSFVTAVTVTAAYLLLN